MTRYEAEALIRREPGVCVASEGWFWMVDSLNKLRMWLPDWDHSAVDLLGVLPETGTPYERVRNPCECRRSEP